MIKQCTNEDKELLLAYLKDEDVYNTFLIADIESYGFEQEFQKVYMEISKGQCRGVYLTFYQNLIIYSKENEINITFLQNLFIDFQPDIIMGKLECIEKLEELLIIYHKEIKDLYVLPTTTWSKNSELKISAATQYDVDDIFTFLQEIPELKSLYTSKKMIADRIDSKTGIDRKSVV